MNRLRVRSCLIQLAHPGEVVFQHACKMGLEGIVSKRLGSRYTSGGSRDWLKFKNPNAPAVKREAEEDWGRGSGVNDAHQSRRKRPWNQGRDLGRRY